MFEILVRDHLDSFLASAGYAKIVQTGRSSIAVLAKSLNSQQQISGKKTGFAMKRRGSTATSVGKTPSAHIGTKELKHFILSEHNHIFGSYLQTHGQVTLMYFCQSSLRFKEANFPADIDRVNEAGSIFDRCALHSTA